MEAEDGEREIERDKESERGDFTRKLTDIMRKRKQRKMDL